MSAPQFYLVAEGNAFAIDGDDLYGAPVNEDGTVDWDCAYDFEPCDEDCLLYTSPSPRDLSTSRMPSSA